MSTAALPLIVATPTPAAAPTPATAGSSGTPSGEGAPFARELQRARQDETPKEPSSGDNGSPHDNAAAQGPQAPSGQAAQSTQAGRNERQRIQRERAAHEGTPAKATRAAHAADAAQLRAGTEGPGREADAADAVADEGEAAPDAASLLAGLMASAASRTTARAQPEGRAAKADGDAVGATGAAGATGSEALRAGLRDAARQAAQDGAGEAAPSTPAEALKAESDTGRHTTRHDGGAFALQQMNLQAATPLAAAPVAAHGADVRDAHVAAPLGSPEFAPAMGAQVSLLVREGVQEARLQLNPAEMGPVTVKIQIDGSNAQVTLSAEQAPTRQALEQALPALAGALREGGLTLTGGGVFEQSRQQQQGEPAPRGGRPGDREEDAAVGGVGGAATAQRWASRGVVDLYA